MSVRMDQSAVFGGRLMEIDQSISDAIERGDGEAVRDMVALQSRELRRSLRFLSDEDRQTWVRVVTDRLRHLATRAIEARDVIAGEIGGMDIQRKLVGVPVSSGTSVHSRRFQA